MTEEFDRSKYLRDSMSTGFDTLLVRSNVLPLGYVVLEGFEIDGIKGVVAFSGIHASLVHGEKEITGVRNLDGVIQWEMFNFPPGSEVTVRFENAIKDPTPVAYTPLPDQLDLGFEK